MKQHIKIVVFGLIISAGTLLKANSVNVAYFGVNGGWQDTGTKPDNYDTGFGDLTAALHVTDDSYKTTDYTTALDSNGAMHQFNYTNYGEQAPTLRLEIVSSKLNPASNTLSFLLPPFANNAPGVFAVFDYALLSGQQPGQTAYWLVYFENPEAINDLKLNLVLDQMAEYFGSTEYYARSFGFPSGFPVQTTNFWQHAQCNQDGCASFANCWQGYTYTFASSSGSSSVCLIYAPILANSSSKYFNSNDNQRLGINIVNSSSDTITVDSLNICPTDDCSVCSRNNSWPTNSVNIDSGAGVNIAAQACGYSSSALNANLTGSSIGTVPLTFSQTNPGSWSVTCENKCPSNISITSQSCSDILDDASNAKCFHINVKDSSGSRMRKAEKFPTRQFAPIEPAQEKIISPQDRQEEPILKEKKLKPIISERR